MKTTLIIAAGAAAFLAWLFTRKYQAVLESSSMETNPRHTDHHLTNVFANAKRHSVDKDF